MKFKLSHFVLLPAVIAGTMGLAQTPPPAAAPATPAGTPPTAGAPGRAGRGNRVVVPLTPEDTAEIAKLNNLPVWTKGAGDGDYSTGPDYAPAPEQTPREGVPQGRIVEFTMNSAESKFYPGVDAPFTRLVSIYIPAQYVPGTAVPFIFSADSYGLKGRQLPTILDNMIADHRLPVMLAVMTANGGTERSMEYDTVSVKFADFVEAEILPRVEKEANVVLTKNPDGRMTYGGSSGGAMALTWRGSGPSFTTAC